MIEDSRAREFLPRVTRRPSPGLAARMKMLAADAEKRMSGAAGGAAAAAAKLEIARSGPRREIQIQVSSAFGSGSDNINSIGVVPEEDSAEVGGGGSNGHGGGGGLRVAGVSSAASSSSVGGSGGGITSRIQTYNSQPAHSFTTATANSTDGVLHLNNNPLANSTPVVRISDENPVGITLEHSSPPSSKYSPSSSSSAKKDSPQTQQPTTIQLPSLPLQVLPTEEDVAQPLGKDDDVEVNQIIAKSVADKPEPQQIAVATPNEGEGEAAAEEQQNSTKEQIIDLRQASNTKQQEGPQEDPAVNPSSHIAPPASPPTTLPSELDTSPYNMAQTECSSSDTHEHSQNGDSHDVQSPNTGVSFDSDNGSSIYEPSCGLQRRCSVFSLSRVSFSSQLSRLTSLALPLSDEFAEKIKIMKTGVEVSNAITSNAKQILRWIDTAKSVLKNLDSEDDVEWAAQGKQSLSEVDTAVHKFSSLMQVYVAAIDQLQARPDAPTVGDTIFKDILTTMEVILEGWDKIQALLKGVKCQVETAMEWNELWTTILQDIQAELEACQTIVFEIEEQRHRSMMEDSDSSNGLMDIETLATIIEEKPGNRTVPAKEDASLLGLFARMQPLRASLDFLPMRLASFQSRAEEIFPSACQDLDIRNNALEKKWKKLNCDAEEMRRELGEDKWVAIFRNAGKQASKMIASVERSLNKLKEAVQQYREGADMTDLALNKKIENYEAKRLHYGPAVQRVLNIIDKGVNERITVNGEILRLHSAMTGRWRQIEQEIFRVDRVLHELHINNSQLRDSISTVGSLDTRSPVSMIHTPDSSPASSVVLSSPAGGTATSSAPYRQRPGSAAGQYAKVSQGALRYNNTPPSSVTGGGPRMKLPPPTRNGSGSLFSPTSSRGASPSPNAQRTIYYTPPASARRPSATSIRSSSSLDNRPRWNISVNTNDLDAPQNFKPLSATTPIDHRKSPAAIRNQPGTKTRIPLPSPLKYGQSPSRNPTPIPTLMPPPPPHPNFNPVIHPTYKYSLPAGNKRNSMYGASGFLKSPLQSPRSASTYNNGGLDVPPRPELRSQHSTSRLSTLYKTGGSTRRTSIGSSNNGDDQQSAATTSAVRQVRPASAMAGGRRMSMLPRPKSPPPLGYSMPGGTESLPSGRASRAKRYSMPPKPGQDNKPRWRVI